MSDEPAAAKRSVWLHRITAAFADGIGLALARFPVASAALVAFGVVSSLAVEDVEPFGPDATLRLLVAIAAAGAAATAMALFGESLGRAAAFRFIASLVASVVAAVLVWFGPRVGIFEPALLAALMLAVPLAPHVVRSNAMRFWTFLHWGFFGAFLAFVSVLLFVLGVSAILEMVRYLFGVGISSRAYEHIYVAATTLVGPLFALGRLPRNLKEEAAVKPHDEDRLSSSLRILQNWVAAPLALVMALVLHAYAAKILLTGDVPRNQIGWIVGGFALFVLTVRVLAHPFLAGRGAPAALFGKVWVVALPVPAALSSYALFLRIADEGVTVERYYLGVALISACTILVLQLPKGFRGDIRLMAAVPVCFLALSAFGPWGMSATVGRSQTARLMQELPRGGAELDFADLSEDLRERARSRVVALDEADALGALLPHLSPADQAVLRNETSAPTRTAVLDRLRLSYGAPSPLYRTFIAGMGGAFDVGGFDTVFGSVSIADAGSGSPSAETPFLTVADGAITVRVGGSVDTIPVAAFAGALPDPARTRTENTKPATIDLRTDSGRSLRFFVYAASYRADTPDEISATFDLALKRGEWPPDASLRSDGDR